MRGHVKSVCHGVVAWLVITCCFLQRSGVLSGIDRHMHREHCCRAMISYAPISFRDRYPGLVERAIESDDPTSVEQQTNK